MSEVTETPILIVNEIRDDDTIGKYIGQCKWFNDRLGFGFLTIQNGPDKGKDIFVHHSGIKPLNSNYKTLNKGEYVNFNVIGGENGMQAVEVTGIGGGSLMCDIVPAKAYAYNKTHMYTVPEKRPTNKKVTKPTTSYTANTP
jgi:CspA family cold shock protein